MEKITGQLIVRESMNKNNKKIYMVFGVIGVEDSNLISEHQYDMSNLTLVNPVDKEKITIGSTPNGLLMEPIWRV